MLLEQRPTEASVGQFATPQFMTRSQSSHRFLAQRSSGLTGNEQRYPDELNAYGPDSKTGAAWRSFREISIFPRHRASEPLSRTSRAEPPLSFPIQPKLVVGSVNDPLEHEADRVAERVMRMAEPELPIRATQPQLSRKCAACHEEEESKPLQTKRAGTAGAPASETPDVVHEVLRSPGQPLDRSTLPEHRPGGSTIAPAHRQVSGPSWDFSRISIVPPDGAGPTREETAPPFTVHAKLAQRAGDASANLGSPHLRLSGHESAIRRGATARAIDDGTSFGGAPATGAQSATLPIQPTADKPRRQPVALVFTDQS